MSLDLTSFPPNSRYGNLTNAYTGHMCYGPSHLNLQEDLNCLFSSLSEEDSYNELPEEEQEDPDVRPVAEFFTVFVDNSEFRVDKATAADSATILKEYREFAKSKTMHRPSAVTAREWAQEYRANGDVSEHYEGSFEEYAGSDDLDYV
ncbi:hypothetical protein IAR50_007331 [Cryptococcus sp. DSM 104548]